MASLNLGLTLRELTQLSITEHEKFIFKDQSYQTDLIQRLVCMREQGQLTDITLSAGAAKVQCHKVTLAAASSYLFDLIHSGKVSDVVQLHNMSPVCLNAIVDYIYTGRLEVSTQYIKEVAASCDQLQLTCLKQAADTYLAEKTTPANCMGLLMFGKEHHLQLTINKARQVLLQNAKNVLHLASDEEFKAVSEASFIDWISSEDLQVPEEDSVFLLAQRWMQSDCTRNNEACAAKILLHFHLGLCTPGYVIKTVQRSPLFRFPKCQQLLQETNNCVPLCIPHDNTEGLESERTRPKKSSIQGHVSSPVCVKSEGTGQIKSSVSRLIIVGGVDNTYTGGNTQCWELCRDMAEWTELAQPPQALVKYPYDTAACTVADGVIISGGTFSMYFGAPSKQAWLYSTATKEWSALPTMQEARSGHGMVSDGRCVYVCGGYGESMILSSVERLDEQRHGWTHMASLPQAISFNKVFHIDGFIFLVSCGECKTFQYNISSNVWAVKADMPCNFIRGAAMTSVEKCIYVIGVPYTMCFMYNTTCDTWTLMASPSQLRHFGSAVLRQDKVLICGGSTSIYAIDCTESIEEYDVSTHTWSESKLKMPKPLWFHHALIL